MRDLVKLSKSRASEKHLMKSYPLSRETQKKLQIASDNANKNIKYNNSIYISSNLHSKEYIVLEKMDERMEINAKKMISCSTGEERILSEMAENELIGSLEHDSLVRVDEEFLPMKEVDKELERMLQTVDKEREEIYGSLVEETVLSSLEMDSKLNKKTRLLKRK